MKRSFAFLFAFVLGLCCLRVSSAQTIVSCTPTLTSHTTTMQLAKPGHCSLTFDTLFNSNFDLLDALMSGASAGNWSFKSNQLINFRNSNSNVPTLTIDPLTGNITLNAMTLGADPTRALQAATKQYVDNAVANVSAGSSSAITGLTGDVLASGPGNATATLATINSSPGQCGDGSHVCQVNIDAKGRITGQQPLSVIDPNAIDSLIGDVATSGHGAATSTLATVNSNTGPCGDATHVPQVTLDGKGRATGCTQIAISAAGSGTTYYQATAGTGLILNLSSGTAFCNGAIVTYPGGTLTTVNGAANYVYLDPANFCSPTSNTSGFTANFIPVAKVTTSGGVITTISDDRTMFQQSGSGGTAGTGVNYNPSTVPFYFFGDSHFNRSTPMMASAASCDGTNCTVTLNNTFVVGQHPGFINGPNGTWAPACLAWSNVTLATVTGTNFTFPESQTTCTGAVSGAGGEIDDERFFVTSLFAQEPFIKNHGTVYSKIGGNNGHIMSFVTNYATEAHQYSPAVTGISPTYAVIQIGWGDINDTCVSSTPLATLEANLKTLWTDLHNDGYTILMTTNIVPGGTGGSINSCTYPEPQELDMLLNNWIVAQGNGVDPNTKGTWDMLVDLASVLGGTGSPSMVANDYNGDPNNGGAKIAADMLNNAVASQQSMNLGALQGPHIFTGEQLFMTTGKYSSGQPPCTLRFGNWASAQTTQTTQDLEICDSWLQQPGSTTNDVSYVLVAGQLLKTFQYAGGVPVEAFNTAAVLGWMTSTAQMSNEADTTLYRDSGGVVGFGGYQGNRKVPVGAWKVASGFLYPQTSDPTTPVNGQIWYNGTSNQLKAYLNGVVTVLGAGLVNPMTTAGDVIVGGTSGTPTRLAAGTTGYCFTANGAGVAPSWQACPGASTLSNPMTTPADMIVGGTGGAPQRIAAGTNGQVLTMVGGVQQWATPSSAIANLFGSGAPNTPTLVQQKIAKAATLAFTNNVASGDVIVVGFSWWSGNNTATPTDTLGTTFTQVYNGFGSGAANLIQVWVGQATASGADTIDTHSGNSLPFLSIYELTHVLTTTDGVAGLHGTTTTVSESITTTTANDVVLSFITGNANGSTFSIASPFALLQQLNGADAQGSASAVQSSAGSITATWTSSTANDDTNVVVFALTASPVAGLEGEEYYDTSTSPSVLYVYHSGAWFMSGTANPKVTLSVTDATTRSLTTGGFTKMLFDTLVTDSASGWSTANNTYTVPMSGTYMISQKMRIADSPTAGVSYGIGVSNDVADHPWFQWYNTGGTRQGALNVRIAHFTAGTVLNAYYFASSTLTSSSGSLDIVLLNTN